MYAGPVQDLIDELGRLPGVDAELLDREAVREMYPFFDYENARFPIKGGLLQRRGGTAARCGTHRTGQPELQPGFYV